jgi:hypothetical protein
MQSGDHRITDNCAATRLCAAAVLAAGLLLGACSSVETQSFVVSEGSQVESAQIAVGADFSKFDRLQAEEMGIFFPTGVAMRVADLERLRQAFRTAFVTELDGYSISRDPGPTTLQVQASLIDLRGSAGTDLTALRRDVRDMATAGSLVFLMEMKDSMTGEVLARAADSAKAPALGTGSSSSTDWQSVEDAARHWAKLFREFLDQNLGR